MATVGTHRKGINQKRRSYYNREGENGFIYRVLDNKGEENGHTATGNQTVTNDSENIIETEDLRKQVEVEQFLAELRKSIVAAGTTQTKEQLDESFRQLAKDLTENNLFVRCLEEADPPQLTSQEPNEEEAQRTLVTTITESIERYKRESEQWATVCEERRSVTEQAKEGYSKERHLNFLKLPSRDVEPLKSFLTPEQLSVLESEVSAEFVSSTTQELDSLEGRLDQELARLSSLGGTNQQTAIAEQSMLNCTPRTLFDDLKNTDPNQTLS